MIPIPLYHSFAALAVENTERHSSSKLLQSPLDLLAVVLGAFDIIAEFLPHVCMILYRVRSSDHQFLRRMFRIASLSTLIGTIIETVVTMAVFGLLWKEWTLALKLMTPMLHMLFASAQLWGSWNLWKMMKAQEQTILKAERRNLNTRAVSEATSSIQVGAMETALIA